MKKLLALTLAATMALSMGIGAFAAFDGSNIKGFADGKTLADGVTLPQDAAWAGPQVLDLKDRHAMDKFEMEIDLRSTLFGDVPALADKTVYYALDADAFMKSDVLFDAPPIAGKKPATWDQVKAILEAETLKGGIAVNAYTVNPGDDDDAFDGLFTNYKDAKLVRTVDSAKLSGVVYFTDSKGKVKETTEPVQVERNLTSTEIRQNKIAVATTMKANSNSFKSITLDARTGQVVVKLATEWVSTGNKDFEAILYLTFNGKRAGDQYLTIIGNMSNPELDVDKNHDFVDISEGYVAVAVEFNPKVAVEVGNGATIHTRMFKGKKYYCTTTRDADQEADMVMRQHKDVDHVLTFKNVGLNSSSDRVTLDTDYKDYWVYDKDLKLLGRGNESLTFSQKFYLANQKLNLEAEDQVEEEDLTEPEEDLAPETGGDGTSNNVNANPGTGR